MLVPYLDLDRLALYWSAKPIKKKKKKESLQCVPYTCGSWVDWETLTGIFISGHQTQSVLFTERCTFIKRLFSC